MAQPTFFFPQLYKSRLPMRQHVRLQHVAQSFVQHWRQVVLALFMMVALTACGGGGGAPAAPVAEQPPSQSTYTMNVTISGISAAELAQQPIQAQWFGQTRTISGPQIISHQAAAGTTVIAPQNVAYPSNFRCTSAWQSSNATTSQLAISCQPLPTYTLVVQLENSQGPISFNWGGSVRQVTGNATFTSIAESYQAPTQWQFPTDQRCELNSTMVTAVEYRIMVQCQAAERTISLRVVSALPYVQHIELAGKYYAVQDVSELKLPGTAVAAVPKLAGAAGLQRCKLTARNEALAYDLACQAVVLVNGQLGSQAMQSSATILPPALQYVLQSDIDNGDSAEVLASKAVRFETVPYVASTLTSANGEMTSALAVQPALHGFMLSYGAKAYVLEQHPSNELRIRELLNTATSFAAIQVRTDGIPTVMALTADSLYLWDGAVLDKMQAALPDLRFELPLFSSEKRFNFTATEQGVLKLYQRQVMALYKTITAEQGAIASDSGVVTAKDAVTVGSSVQPLVIWPWWSTKVDAAQALVLSWLLPSSTPEIERIPVAEQPTLWQPEAGDDRLIKLTPSSVVELHYSAEKGAHWQNLVSRAGDVLLANQQLLLQGQRQGNPVMVQDVANNAALMQGIRLQQMDTVVMVNGKRELSSVQSTVDAEIIKQFPALANTGLMSAVELGQGKRQGTVNLQQPLARQGWVLLFKPSTVSATLTAESIGQLWISNGQRTLLLRDQLNWQQFLGLRWHSQTGSAVVLQTSNGQLIVKSIKA